MMLLHKCFEPIMYVQGRRESETENDNLLSKQEKSVHKTDEDHLLPRQEFPGHLHPDTCLQTIDTKHHSFPPTLDR